LPVRAPRFHPLGHLIAGALALPLIGCGAPANDRPNVLLITLDTTRADRLGCYGHGRDTSPHLDTLAADGARFEHAVATASLTPVAHASILSGLLPH
jgi:arylsulfatase A-like enzyme